MARNVSEEEEFHCDFSKLSRNGVGNSCPNCGNTNLSYQLDTGYDPPVSFALCQNCGENFRVITLSDKMEIRAMAEELEHRKKRKKGCLIIFLIPLALLLLSAILQSIK